MVSVDIADSQVPDNVFSSYASIVTRPIIHHSVVIDCGSSHHLINDISLFESLTPIAPRLVTIASGQSNLYAVAIGGVKFTSLDNGCEFPVQITEAFYVPFMQQSVLSVPKLIGRGFNVSFSDSSCIIGPSTNFATFTRIEIDMTYTMPVIRSHSPSIHSPSIDDSSRPQTQKDSPQQGFISPVRSDHCRRSSDRSKPCGRHSDNRASSWRSAKLASIPSSVNVERTTPSRGTGSDSFMGPCLALCSTILTSINRTVGESADKQYTTLSGVVRSPRNIWFVPLLEVR